MGGKLGAEVCSSLKAEKMSDLAKYSVGEMLARFGDKTGYDFSLALSTKLCNFVVKKEHYLFQDPRRWYFRGCCSNKKEQQNKTHPRCKSPQNRLYNLFWTHSAVPRGSTTF